MWWTARSEMHNEAYLHVSEHLLHQVRVFDPPTAEKEYAGQVSRKSQ